MALNFKLHVNKVCFESLCISTVIRMQEKSRNVFKENVFMYLASFVSFWCRFWWSLPDFGDSQSFFGLDASFCQDV